MSAVAVVGAGYVGVATALAIVGNGHDVVLVESSALRLEEISTGRALEAERDLPAAWEAALPKIRLAMAVEQRSTHPIAAAVVRLAKQHALQPAHLATLTRVGGQGIEGIYEGKPVRIGNYAFAETLIPVCFRRHTQMMVDRIVSSGNKAIVIAHDEQALVLSLADTPREGAKELTDELRDVGVDSAPVKPIIRRDSAAVDGPAGKKERPRQARP